MIKLKREILSGDKVIATVQEHIQMLAQQFGMEMLFPQQVKE